MAAIQAWIPVFVAIISTILGPLIMFYVNKTYTDKSIEKNNKNIIEQIEDSVIGDHTLALDKLFNTLNDYLEKREKSEEKVQLDLKLIAVAMTFSWDFILDKLPEILKKHPSVSIKLSVCFVDCDHLSGLKISTEDRDWADTSRQVETKIPKFKRNMLNRFGSRFSCEFRTYANLPHWHGWLVKDKETGSDRKQRNNETVGKYLFLGRTRWEHTYENNKRRSLPKLTVGQNEYRYYTDESKQGNSRINLFEQWHTYYFEKAFVKKL